VIIPELHVDERGFFARTYSLDEFKTVGLNPVISECSISYNERKGTLRGMHYQAPPHGEAKLVRCTKGSVFDVAVDLRADSPTFRLWEGVTLSAENRWAFFIPEGLAHGFLTLEDATELSYQISTRYDAGAAGGFRWDDPVVGIEWPKVVPYTIAPKDLAWPRLSS
jgi:dTDP-4-dehydrorhamnose 3,5-epimerase